MMQLGAQWLVLLASREEMHRVWGRFDNEKPGISNNQLMIIVGAIALALLVGMIWNIAKRPSSKAFSSNSSGKLFRELCAIHGLTRVSRRLLKRLAEARGVTDPAMLFVEPQHFDTQGLPAELRPSAKELRQMCEKLFR